MLNIIFIQWQEKSNFLQKLIMKCDLFYTKVPNINKNNIDNLIKHKQS